MLGAVFHSISGRTDLFPAPVSVLAQTAVPPPPSHRDALPFPCPKASGHFLPTALLSWPWQQPRRLWTETTGWPLPPARAAPPQRPPAPA
eukprot:2478278-Rhodomonas_salina.3